MAVSASRSISAVASFLFILLTVFYFFVANKIYAIYSLFCTSAAVKDKTLQTPTHYVRIISGKIINSKIE